VFTKGGLYSTIFITGILLIKKLGGKNPQNMKNDKTKSKKNKRILKKLNEKEG